MQDAYSNSILKANKMHSRVATPILQNEIRVSNPQGRHKTEDAIARRCTGHKIVQARTMVGVTRGCCWAPTQIGVAGASGLAGALCGGGVWACRGADR